MKSFLSIAASAFLAVASAKCASETTVDLKSSVTELKLMGFEAKSIERFTSSGMGNKIILKGYDVEPIVQVTDNGVTVTAGTPCDGGGNPGDAGPTVKVKESAAFAFGVSSLFSKNMLTLALTTLLLTSPYVAADTCTTNDISIEIYTEFESYIKDEYKLDQCPKESQYYAHHPSVYSGFSGCVSEVGFAPCAQEPRDVNLPEEFNSTSVTCVAKTENTYANRVFWILWGHPMDKYELVTRIGETPTVVFPFTRGPYPRVQYGLAGDETTQGITEGNLDDTKTAKAVIKDFLVYIGALKEEEKGNWLVSMTEGAENGIQMLWASKALEIAQTTCNRNIYVLMEAPAYGYSTRQISSWVNSFSTSFYNSSECTCYPDCLSPTVSVMNRGFFPPNIPSELGGDGNTYAADSALPSSPWMESMVFPENPSGRIKTPVLPNANRRVCDGVYVWPMYFYYNDFKIPKDKMPDCAAWAFALTKGYSAALRSGWILYKKNAPESVMSPLVSIVKEITGSIGYGYISEYVWSGQMQLQKFMMKKPLSDPTSWIGAYSSIMKEKWDVLDDAFKDCPYIDLTNMGAGAYAFFLFKKPFLGMQGSSSISGFFMDVLGVKATTYNWGFRGADPSEYYGEGVTRHDFVRLQLYRDVNVYKEVARRAKIICTNPSTSIFKDSMSITDYVNTQTAKRNRRLHEVENKADRRALLKEEVPQMSDAKIDRLLENMSFREAIDKKVSACAEEDYSMSCLFNAIGRDHVDE